MVDLPFGLQQSIETGQCVLFLGAGVGYNLLDKSGNRAPLAMELGEELAINFNIDTSEFDLSKIAKIVELRKGRTELETYIRKRLTNLKPDDNFKSLFNIRWKAIFTTNYDDSIQRAYDLLSHPPQQPIIITSTPNLVQPDIRFEVPVYYLHGNLFTDSPHIVITEDDYVQFREHRRMLFELLKKEFINSTLLYVGYSNQDNNWKIVRDEMKQEFYPSALPRSYRIAPHTDSLDEEILRSQNIETIKSKLSDFIDTVKIALATSNFDNDRLQQTRNNIPTALKDIFDKNPASVSRLLGSWEYVNYAQFNEIPNIYDFLRGNRPNWSLIGNRDVFERDIEEEIYNDLIDYATDTRSHPIIKILLSSAGYGVTTLMMCLASKLVQQNAGHVFMLKPGQSIREGDIEFACSLFDTPFFFIDNASDYASTINNIRSELKDNGIRALFFLGERINEWRQISSALRGKEYELEALSEPEIYRLLEYLEKNAALNTLESLSSDLRFVAIKQKHGKDLLVTLREATEGKSFDAILEDEFQGIIHHKAREAYLIVCCFFQHGVFIRENLLADMIEMELSEFYEVVNNSTEGIIKYDLLNQSNETYGARARHRIIASVVWERCSNSSDKENILQRALKKLNLNYKTDKDAFDNFIQDDRLIEDIGSLEAKIRFFDLACKKDPKNPYVRQHYARMLFRAESLPLALTQIDEAIKLNPKLRVLYHTKGHILSEVALTQDSLDIARRRLTQSEDCFNKALNINNRDEYSYQGLARLYFRWAQRFNHGSEQTLYITKAEEVISRGLKNASVRDSLWIVSSEVQNWLNNQESRIDELEKAVKESPNSPIPRYLLARIYRKQKQPQKAISILDSVLKQNLDEFRIIIEYAIALIYIGKKYSEAIAILNLSTHSGYRDPRFIATLGGMLFLNEEFSKSKEVFNESSRRDFNSRELNTIQFRPPNPNLLDSNLQFNGKVIKVGAGYALIEVVNYPPIICPATKYAGLILKRGMSICFDIVFNAKGPLADKPQENI